MFMFSDQYSQLYDLNMGMKYFLPLYYFSSSSVEYADEKKSVATVILNNSKT